MPIQKNRNLNPYLRYSREIHNLYRRHREEANSHSNKISSISPDFTKQRVDNMGIVGSNKGVISYKQRHLPRRPGLSPILQSSQRSVVSLRRKHVGKVS